MLQGKPAMTFRKHLWKKTNRQKKTNPQLLGGLTNKMTFSKSDGKQYFE